MSDGLVGHIFTGDDLPFDEEKHFKQYHHYEVMDDAKNYVGHQKIDYGHGERPYRFSGYTVNLFEKRILKKRQTYVVAVEEFRLRFTGNYGFYKVIFTRKYEILFNKTIKI